ncbi:unnamed protein product [Rotaria socialis]|uniref:VPS10 domain-containing protein n=1 Tax=Rotaria socialis TaxID=392032 RepID=A0A819WCG1_9BILA|nr:unnamed protein product [Rotaria socialis]CAF4123670.1 unnamed protein product [Rotaria socialis]
MHRRIYCVSICVFLFIAHLGLCSDDTTAIISISEEYNNDLNSEEHAHPMPPIPAPIEATTIIDSVAENVPENIIVNVTESTTTLTTVMIINEKREKQFRTDYSLNGNLSSSSLSDMILNSYINDLITLVFKEHEILLVNKTDGTIKHVFQYAHIVPTNQEIHPSNFLVIFDENTQTLWTFNSTHQQNTIISFKPKQIHIFPEGNNSWIAETSDEVDLYISQDFGIAWKAINSSSSSAVLGWANKANAVVIVQHSRYIKLLDVTTHQITPILNDVSSAKLFSRYLLAKTTDGSSVISHVNNLAEEGFRSLPKRLQSQGNFYCAIEDVNTQDLLLLFITDNKLQENNETRVPTTCNLMSYSKQNLFNLPNINCESINIDNSYNTIECSTKQIPFYQVRGLLKTVFLANVGPEATTMVSFDNGVTWNKTHYECDKMMSCPENASILISSLVSSNDAPGILVGKAFDGISEYVAISSNGGRLWHLSFKGHDYLTAISNPNALIVTIPKTNHSSLDHSFRYSTDYGRNWHHGKISNDTSSQILSLIADKNNMFYILSLNTKNKLNLIQLDFNLLIAEKCAHHQLKQWSLHGICINGSKFYYRRRTSGSHCLDDASQVQTESCSCLLTDFECSPGYRRSKDGICLPKSHYILTQDCSCHDNNTLVTKRRGYVKPENNHCNNGIEDYLSDAFITRRDPNQPNFFVYGTNSRTNRTIAEIHSNDFDQEQDDDEDDEDDEVLTKNANWSVEEAYEITALVFDENSKQVYMAVEHDQSSIIYRIGKNLRQKTRSNKKLTFDSNNELYKGVDERIEYLTIDGLTQNLYILIRNKKTLQQKISILNIRTHKKRTIVKNQHIQPSILIVDPIKTNLYWISHDSPSKLNIGNLQGQIKKQIQLLSTDSNISYMSYDPITHAIVFVSQSTIYGLNTLDYHNKNHLSSRIIYEHSSIIQNALFIHPILYFTQENNDSGASPVRLHSIDILAKSYAKNMAKFKNVNSLKLFVDMAPILPLGSTSITNPCINSPCSDLCIPLEHGRFRCLCNDDARYQSCSCPSDEKFIAGACQAKNEQCAPGRVLCQNRIHCAESARICEQDHTQYTEAFKATARCTIDKPNDGFDCHYTGIEINNSNRTCIPIEWLCDGAYDCPYGNDEDHCHKMTTTMKPAMRIPSRCLTDKKFTHVMCDHKCIKINDLCQNVSNGLLCSDQFHLNCKQTQEKNEYVCKCSDDRNHCIGMIEHCDEYEHCERICKDSIHYATSKLNKFDEPSSIVWMILIIIILMVLVIAIVLITLRYLSRRKNSKKNPTQTRTRTEPATTTNHTSSNDAHEQLLSQAHTTNKTS